MAPTINELTQAQRARLQMTETRERMRNGVHVAALPPGLVNLGDAARQRAGNASHAGSRKCSRHRRRQQHHHVLQYVVSIKQHVASARIAEGHGALRIVSKAGLPQCNRARRSTPCCRYRSAGRTWPRRLIATLNY
ncbi:hypothetical protein [Xanthomonas oryzae]|uniref:hypothetical protein n=1 Tax=Xanthomonas oryzae TaxID=347 RepID=UPI000B2C3329|nr:hypothetical protein [Xanthomonas oryzae]WVN06052.1 hypothetical protein V1208_17610 [Xanthomonas oryzae pv. oryzicola]